MKINDLIKKQEFAEDIIPENVEGLNNLLMEYSSIQYEAFSELYGLEDVIPEVVTSEATDFGTSSTYLKALDGVYKELSAVRVETIELRRILDKINDTLCYYFTPPVHNKMCFDDYIFELDTSDGKWKSGDKVLIFNSSGGIKGYSCPPLTSDELRGKS